jgi:hypothetical protein
VSADFRAQLDPLLGERLEAESRCQATVDHYRRDSAVPSQRATVIASLLRCPGPSGRDEDSSAQRWP